MRKMSNDKTDILAKAAEIAGRPAQPRDAAVIGVPAIFANHPPGTETHTRNCEVCGLELLLSTDSVKRIKEGFGCYCLHCAIERHPDMICGTDPGTGKDFTLAQWWRERRPGAYRPENTQ